MRSWMIAFSLGIFCCGFIAYLPHPSIKFLLLLIPVLNFKYRLLRLPAAFSLGLFWFLCWAQHGVEQLLPKTLEQQDIWVHGVVVSLPQQSERSQRFEFSVTKLCPYEQLNQCDFATIKTQRKKIRLNNYQRQIIEPGQHWQLQVRLKRPHGFANPGGFDYEAYLVQHRISATGYIRKHGDNRLLLATEGGSTRPSMGFNGLRFQYREKLNSLFSGLESAEKLNNIGLIKALTIGDRNNIRDKEWELLAATGTNHLVAVSGLHIGLVAYMVYRVSVYLLSFFIPGLLCIPAQRSGAAIAVLAAFFYTGLAGFSLPAQRAFMMVAVVMLGHLLTRKTSLLNAYCLAMGMVLLLNPLAPQSSGFWLSFAAVGLLILVVRKQGTANSTNITITQKLMSLLQSQFYLFIGLSPLMLIFFQQQSLLSPLVNLVAIPFVSLLVVPLCLFSLILSWISLPLMELCLHAADSLLTLFMMGLQLTVSISADPLLHWPTLSSLGMAVLCGAVLMILIARRKRFKAMAAVAGLTLLLPSPFLQAMYYYQNTLVDGEFKLTVLDVGQGLALVLQTRQHALVYDSGPAFSTRFDAGKGVVLPYLGNQNITNPDVIMLSHGDSDHVGGLPALIKAYPNSHYISSDSAILPQQLNSSVCLQGQRWEWDGVSFEILHPDVQGMQHYSSNDGSCVLKISVGRYSVLLTGDIEKKVETALIKSNAASLAASILIAPHHGSNTSSSAPFLNTVNPQYIVFSSGYLSRFNHPHPLVVRRSQAQGSLMLTTATTGAISFTLSGSTGIDPPQLYRLQRKRYWTSIQH